MIRDNRRREEAGELEPAVAVRRAHHGNLHALIAQSSDTAGPFSFDRGPPFEFEAQFAKEINRASEVLDDDSHVVHPFERHVPNGGILSVTPNGRCGTEGKTMRVPYANKWQNETDELRRIVRDCGLVEESKWGKPCFTHQKRNVAILIPLKDACALSFFKGALLQDPKRILQKIGEAQAGRWIKFTSGKEIGALQATLRSYIHEAIQVEESGKKVVLKKASDYVVPEELQARLNAAPKLKAAFAALTPGRRKSYILHIAGAKQAKTRAARAEKCVPMILSGRGLNERN